jgi:hypothetical protein
MAQERLVVIFDGPAVERDAAAGRIFEPGDDAQEGRFSAAGRADEGEAMDVVEFEADPVDHGVRAEALDHVLEAKFHI